MQSGNRKTKDQENADNPAALPTTENNASSLLRRKNGNHTVSDDVVAPAPKRQRVSQACEQCRAKKYKCNAVHPTCSACASSNEPCTYRIRIKKRGLPTGYVRVLEMLWGAVFVEHAGSEAAVERLLTGEKRIFARIETDGAYAEVLLKTWRQSTISKAVDRYLGNEETRSDGKRAETKSEDRESRLDEGWTARATDTMRPEAWGPYESANYNDAGSPHTRTANHKHDCTVEAIPISTSFWASSSSIPLSQSLSPRLNGATAHSAVMESPYPPLYLVLPSNAMQLINIYISYTHCWFPVIDRDIFWKVSFEYSGRTLKMSANSPGCGKHAALWAILAYASIHEAGKGSGADACGSEAVRLSTEQMYSNARGLIPSEEANFEFGHIQALLLLVLVNLGLGNVTASWLLIGQAVRRALDMGLGASSANFSGYQDEETSSGSHRHIFSGCFALDTLVAARLGRRPHLRRADAAQIGDIRADGQEEYELWRDCFNLDPGRGGVVTGGQQRLHVFSIFLQFIRLAGILNDMLCEGLEGGYREHYYQEVSTRLQRWDAELPPHCRLALSDNSHPQQSTRTVPHLLSLHLMYQSIIAFLQLQLDHGFQGASGLYDQIRETYFDAASHSLGLLERFSENFGIFVMPATFQYFTNVVSHGMSQPNNQTDGEMSSTGMVQRDLRQILLHLDGVWGSQNATPTIFPKRSYNEDPRWKGTQTTSYVSTGSGTMNYQQRTDPGPSAQTENSKPPTVNLFARPGYHIQVPGAHSASVYSNIPAAETQAFLQSSHTGITTFPMWAQNHHSIGPYANTPPSTSPTNPVEVIMTGLQTGSDMDTTQSLSPSELRNLNQHSPMPYATRTAPLDLSGSYANPENLPSDLRATDAVFDSPFSIHHSTGDFGTAGNIDAVWDELACLDDGERYAFQFFSYIFITMPALTNQ